MLICSSLLFASYTYVVLPPNTQKSSYNYTYEEHIDNTIETRFSLSEAGNNYYRLPITTGTFEEYLINLPLKPKGYKTHYYNGEEKYIDVQIGVIDMEVGNTNLQQSAEAIIRLRAEYLYKSKLYGRLHFYLSNGFNFSYTQWAEGFRLNSGKSGWEKTSTPNYDYTTFREYLDVVFANTGITTLSREMKKISLSEVKAGDVLIQCGHPGHALIIVDVLRNDANNTVKLMFAQSFSSAQEIEILKNYEDDSPWFSLSLSSTENGMISTPEWTFYIKDLKRFTN